MNVYGELTSALLENRTADPTLSAVRKGRLWMRTDLSTLKVDLGGSTDTLVLLAATQVLTGKTIDTSTNTIKSTGASATQVLTADGANNTSWATPTSAPDSSMFYENGSIFASVAANALTVALKDKSGFNPAGGSQVSTAFRNATATTGTYAMVNVSAALSVVAPDAQSLGLTIGVTSYLYVYLINNAGTPELALSGSSYWDEGQIQNTTAIASASSLTVLYSTTARTGVAIRLIGRIAINLGASTHWSNSPTEISNIPFTITKQLVIGSAQTAIGARTNTAYGTGTNAPAVTIVAQRSSLYKIWGIFPTETGSAVNGGVIITATSGSPTILFSQDCPVIAAGAVSGEALAEPFILCYLVAGSSYTFTVQTKSGAGQVSIRSDLCTNGTVLVAQEL